ncbi:hypothetical protein Cgig2_020414 [Carnegiea gigantea]|uniref:Uncharacterized protein n=1 Tax=Carnegiea gigantea TaxID=171969 RepID=A0A9Q1K6P0_9CARY|nr:hypothetical protein Cgig2_020414 [Carnegiea gigantea]
MRGKQRFFSPSVSHPIVLLKSQRKEILQPPANRSCSLLVRHFSNVKDPEATPHSCGIYLEDFLPINISRLNFSTERGDSKFHDSMSSIVKEIIIEEGQGSHLVSILEDGYLEIPLIYSTKVNAMKRKVVLIQSNKEVFGDKFGNNCNSAFQGVDNQRHTWFRLSEHVVSQQREMEVSGENTNGNLASNQLIYGS